ncbi:MAG: Kef family K(+) transporter [Alphaproteobacteria bacterium]|nr:Kef family K(+) transporter [Alphaproteobacteria bacterium]
MPHDVPLISTLVIALGLAWVFGAIANRFRLPPLVGYLIAGIVIGPFTPGFVADQDLAIQLAELGVILLMFGVGLHFSLEDLLSVRAIALPGAIVQIACATLLGMGLAFWMGWDLAGGFVFGLALSVASTVVLLRAMQERRLIETERGRIAVGWLIVEDIVMVMTLVLLPGFVAAFAGEDMARLNVTAVAATLGWTLAKFAGFVAVMLIVGKRVIPWVLHYMAHTGSRELFRLSVFAIALGAAYGAAELFGVSFALGAFFAGMILSESALSQQAAQETLPLRDAFAVLFFVSVGMLFDPAILVHAPIAVLGTLLIIIVGKSLAAYGIMRLFGYSIASALTISASLAQIGEFSFILANLGVELKVLPEDGRDLILAGAIMSIILNPFMFSLLDHILVRREKASEAAAQAEAVVEEEEEPPREPIRPTHLTDHVVLVGHGRVGSHVSNNLSKQKIPFFVIEDNDDVVHALKEQGIEAFSGNAAAPDVLTAANLNAARCLLVAIPDAFEGGQVVQQARASNPHLPIIARSHSDAETEHLLTHGADIVIVGEHEIAKAMLEQLAADSADKKKPAADETKS